MHGKLTRWAGSRQVVRRAARALLLLLLGGAACEPMTDQEAGDLVRMLQEALGEPEAGGPGGALAAWTPSGTTPAQARDFAGTWEQTLEGVTHQEVLEIEVSGDAVAGVLTELARGYFSSRSQITAQYGLQGTVQGGVLMLRMWSGDSSPEAGFAARMYRRGEYLVLQIGDALYGYARPGRPLVAGAQGSAEAERYLRAIAGARVRVALCGDGSIALDRSDVASAGGFGMGDAVARRGRWSVVLYAGAPAVRAQWQGTGSSYDLVQYIQVAPAADGRSAVVDGLRLPAVERC